MATEQQQIDYLKQQVAQLATKTQWQALTDLLTSYKADTDQQLASHLARIATLEGEVHSLKSRVYALENP